MAYAVGAAVYNRTLGYMFGSGGQDAAQNLDAPEDQEFICMGYLERQADIFVRWALKNDKGLLSRSKVK